MNPAADRSRPYCDHKPYPRLVASGFGDQDTGGGIFVFDGAGFERVDTVSTTGLCVTPSGLVRCLRGASDNCGGEIVIYDARGILRYLRVDELTDAHDVVWDGDSFVVVSSAANSILWVSASGQLQRVWRAPGEDDSWHLNGLIQHDGRLLACAFGRYARYREWKHRLLAGDGVLFELETGGDVLTGLCAPHSPRYVDGAWLVCSSGRAELLAFDGHSGVELRRTALRSFTRGLAVTDDYLFVGESANRALGQGETASVAVLDRRSWQTLDRLPLPCREVYDLVAVPEELCGGLRTGFRTNPLRVREQDQLGLLKQLGVQPRRIWAVSDPLSPEQCRIAIRAQLPARMACGSSEVLECRLANRGDAFLVSVPPHPVRASYHWVAACGTILEGLRTDLPTAVAPGAEVEFAVRVQAPDQPGTYILRLTLVQELVAWFDDLDAQNVCATSVIID